MVKKFTLVTIKLVGDIKPVKIKGNLVEFIKFEGIWFIRINRSSKKENNFKFSTKSYTKARIIKLLRKKLN